MHSVAKLVIGLLVLAAGLFWYGADFFGHGVAGWIGLSALSALKTVFVGLFGLFLIIVGVVVIWIEAEDMKWQSNSTAKSKKK